MLSKEELIAKLQKLQEESEIPGGEERLEKQRKQGKLSARERVYSILDPGSFQEIDRFVTHRCRRFSMEKSQPLGDGVVTGYGEINGRKVCIFSQDFTVFGGSLSGTNAAKICKLMDLALKMRVPLIGLNDSGGARIQEGVEALGGYAEIFWRNVQASGIIPQISIILGPCAGGAVYSPAITDFILMRKQNSFMFVTGPDVIQTVTHEKVTKDQLGGSTTHMKKSGICAVTGEDELDTLQKARKLISYLPSHNQEKPPTTKSLPSKNSAEILDLIPEDPKLPYDMKGIIDKIIDEESFFELHVDYAPNIITAFAHMEGQTIGIIANQPMHLAGCLDINASRKGARFVRFCDAFNIPLLTLVDVPGFLPGTDQEYNGIIIHGAKILYAFSEATVAKITLIIRKAYGGAYDVMASKHIRADFNFAYPQAEIAVMGAEGAIRILYREEIKKEPAKAAKLMEEYQAIFNTPYIAASRGYIDEVIHPKDTRIKIIESLKMVKNKMEKRPFRKHGNIPL